MNDLASLAGRTVLRRMESSAVFQWIWPPLMLGSWWARIPAVLVSTIIVIRTYLEDEFLTTELQGYLACTKGVKYRLVPRIW
jgi:protein-S-isoprenylcysteine O-methyltransferase Ste14